MNIVTASFNTANDRDVSWPKCLSKKWPKCLRKKNRAPEQWYNKTFEPRGKAKC